MASTKEKYIKNHYKRLIEADIKNNLDNKSVVLDILKEHLTFIPRKLYKYRNCSQQNFDYLTKQEIWMSCAKDFIDPFDSIINIDLEKDFEKIKKWFLNNICDIVYFGLKSFFDKRNIKFDVDRNKINWIKNEFFTDSGRLLKTKARLYMQKESLNVQQYEITLEKIEEYLASSEDKLKQKIEDLIKIIIDSTKTSQELSLIYCLTEDHNNPVMWENYSDNYTGFCIEYDFSKKCDYDSRKNLIFLLPILYRKKLMQFDMFPLFEIAVKKHLYGDEVNQDEEKTQSEINLNLQLLQKKHEYNYEKEWRFAIKNHQNNIQPFPFVSAIYLGKDISTENESMLIKIASKLEVPVYKQYLPLTGVEYKYKKLL